MGQRSFFDIENRLQRISKLGDPLERLSVAIPWEQFRPLLEPVHEKERKSNAGRKPFDVVLMFKILVLQTLYNLADEQVEYQIRDRLSFARFLGLGIEDEVPDATTVWRFRERLKELGLLARVFNRFDDFLAAKGFEAKAGQLIDASIVPVPIQRNPREENNRIKNGEVPEDWGEAKRAQKDVDGRWTGKRGNRYFGYKNHISVDAEQMCMTAEWLTPSSIPTMWIRGYGPTAPTAVRRRSRCCRTLATKVTFARRASATNRSRMSSRRTTVCAPRFAPVSSISSASRRTAWVGNSSAPLVWLGPRSKAA